MMVVFVTFFTVVFLMLGTYWFFVVRLESESQLKLRKRLRGGGRKDIIQGAVVKDVRPLSSFVALERLLRRAGGTVAPVERLIEESGTKMTVGRFVLMSLCAGLAAYLLVGYMTARLVLAVFVGLLAMTIPYLYLTRQRTVRIRRFEEQFPDAIDLIARALRAGHAFSSGLEMVADELPAPVGLEFRLLYDRQNYGMSLPDALRALADRIPLVDARFFVTAVLTQREAGGNLAEVLDNLAAVIRERFKVKRQVRVVTAHGRITGWVLAGLPPVLALAMFVVVPDTMRLLITDPIGPQMVIAGITLQIIGTLIIRKLVDIEY